MHITIVTIGTRGDVQPYIALSQRLIAAGHSVVLCSHSPFRAFVEEHGVPFAPMSGDVRAILTSPEGRAVLSRRNPVAMTRGMVELAEPVIRQIGQDILAAAQGADLILGSSLGYFNAITASQVSGASLIMASLQWWTPTRAFPVASGRSLPPGAPFAGLLNRASYTLADGLLFALGSPLLNRIRREQTGLPPLRYPDYFAALDRQTAPAIYAVSPHVLPRPREWGANVHQTGFWYLDQAAGYAPPQALQEFLDAGDPPVYIGFGSMSDRDPAAMGALVREAVRRAGVRAVILSGWGGIDAADDGRVFMLDAAPHDWLFPRMAAVVHHGGIGTMAEAARAGVPQVIVAYSADQPFWGEQTRRIGVSPAWFRRYGLTADRLAGAIRAALDDRGLRDRAASLAVQLRAEDGAGHAAQVIGALRPS